MSVEKYPYVVIFIPAYNEEDSLVEVIAKINKNYRENKPKGYWVDIIVIDDGSSDRTVEVSEKAGVKKVISHMKNLGLGAATRTGIQRAYEMGADIAVKIDADFQHDPDDIDKVIRPILEDKADCVFGSRLTGGLKYKMPFHRALGNRFFSKLVSVLTGLKITDAQTGLIALGKRYISNFEIIADYNETQQLIMDAWGRHMRVIEVDVVFHKRMTGKSFISWRYPFKVLPTIIRLFVHINPLKVFIPLGGFFIFLGFCLALYVLSNGSGFFGDTSISILVVGGIQIIIFGLLADLISKNR
ncbi:MAG: glycosyltransferase family 2 protein [Candidatus Omnitrophica bacterium]|nr:glycosyltransferase family 2 protein [Candidatus Omnitrophota bacterium]